MDGTSGAHSLFETHQLEGSMWEYRVPLLLPCQGLVRLIQPGTFAVLLNRCAGEKEVANSPATGANLLLCAMGAGEFPVNLIGKGFPEEAIAEFERDGSGFSSLYEGP